MRRVLLVAILGASSPALAESTIRLVGAEPASAGAILSVGFYNEWPSPQRTEENAEVDLFVYDRDPNGLKWLPQALSRP